jgi:hypothetical protein
MTAGLISRRAWTVVAEDNDGGRPDPRRIFKPSPLVLRRWLTLSAN